MTANLRVDGILENADLCIFYFFVMENQEVYLHISVTSVLQFFAFLRDRGPVSFLHFSVTVDLQGFGIFRHRGHESF